jgi:hypothetical protein
MPRSLRFVYGNAESPFAMVKVVATWLRERLRWVGPDGEFPTSHRLL